MKTISEGRAAPLTPDERLGLLPFVPSHSSGPLGWSGVRVEHFPHQPGGDVTEPPLTQLFLVLRAAKPHHARIAVNGDVFDGDVPPGSGSLIPVGASSRHQWTGDAETTHVQIDPFLFRKVAVEGFDRDPDRLLLPAVCCDRFHPSVEHDLAALRDELLDGGPGGRLCAESLANVLAVHLIRHLASGPAVRGLTGVLARHVVKAVEEFVRDNLDQSIGLADLAAAAHLSEYHFARLFKATTGQTPHQFVITKRVERAKELIRERRLTLAEVAAAVGFADQSHLHRHFKKLVGVTPKRFG